ncbi:hypothetical protein [Halocola ammonii]
MRVVLILIGFIVCCLGQARAGGWLNGEIELESGETLRAEIRHQKYFSEKLVCRIGGEKKQLSVDEVKAFTIGEERWIRIELTDLEGQLVFARVEISEALYEAKITEVKCTCDNSYQSRKVWIWKSDNELFVFKKRHFAKGLINWDQQKKPITRHLEVKIDSLPENLKFDDVPEFVSGLK